jgi:diguanylate cyclase (GGDEF)-like protein/excisionase family DNA binding protein
MTGRSNTRRYLRVQQAAELLGVSATTVRRWADHGRIACERTPSDQRRFLRQDLERPVSGRRCGSAERSPAVVDGDRYKLLFETSLELASSLELDEVLQSAARRLTATLGIPGCDIYRLEGAGTIACLVSTMGGANDASWVGKRIALADWACERSAIETARPVVVCSRHDPRLSQAEQAVLRRYGQDSFVSLPLIARDKVIGLVDLVDHRERTYSAEEIATAEAVGQLVALAIEHATLYDEVKRLHLGNLRALSSALSAKDYYTLGHAGRVAAYMALLGAELGWSQEYLTEVEDVAFLHDIGKIGVSDRVLLKAGPLTSEEWELIRQHPGISAEIVRPLFDAELVAGVRHHHEHYDGSGYPDHLAAEEIPMVARAMCVVDCYDAMSCERPYRHALSYRQCLGELRRCAGTQFDPEMVEAFLNALARLRRRRRWVTRLAAQAAGLIDADLHATFRTRADELRPEYKETVAALRRFRDAHPPLRFATSFALVEGQCVTVLDSGESEDDVSHCGEPWLAEDQLARALVHEERLANVLTADDFGVWVSGIAPIRDSKGTVVAAITVDAPAVETLASDRQGDRSHTLAAMLQAAAIRYSRAEVEAITDGLTGLYNHRYLHERLEEELRRARRRESPLALLFLDCDHFKDFNDSHGHKAGDAALARIARVLEKNSRRVDLAARYGGEEFVLVLVDTDHAGALTVAERIRAEVEADATRAGHPLTVSIGVTAFPDDAQAKDELLDKTDWAMYMAKRSGRNRVLAFADRTVVPETWLSRRGR